MATTSTSSISGLVSGLDTTSIIDQLMSIEAQSQNTLKTRLTTQQSTLKSLQDLNSKLGALATQAKGLGTTAAWQPLTATSSSTAVQATATTGTSPGSFDVQVVRTATTHSLTFATTATSTDHVTGTTDNVVLTVNGTPTTLTTDGTLSGLVSALNASGTGVRAGTVRLDDGTQRLSVRAATSGAAAAFTLTAEDGTDLLGGATVQAGQDAAITIGPDTLHSATNTFANAVPGLSMTISAAAVGTTVSVAVSTDTGKVRDQVKGLVDAVNAALTQMDTVTASGTRTTTGGALAGDPVVASVRGALVDAVFPADGSSLAAYGLQTDRDGKLVFDATAFEAAYAADPATVSAALGGSTTSGFAGRVASITRSASDPYSGSLTSEVTGSNTMIRELQDSISDWDTRLALKRQSLTAQFTALETALSQMQSQSSWLSSQLASLPSTSTSSSS